MRQLLARPDRGLYNESIINLVLAEGARSTIHKLQSQDLKLEKKSFIRDCECRMYSSKFFFFNALGSEDPEG